MNALISISMSIGYDDKNSKWLVIRDHMSYSVPQGITLQDFVVMHANDLYGDRAKTWDRVSSDNLWYHQLYYVCIDFSGDYQFDQCMVPWWRAFGRGVGHIKNQTIWADISLMDAWLRDQVSSVETECLMRVLSRDTA
jgi:hypothetical protein